MRKINKATALMLYEKMLMIRKFEEKLFFLFSTRAMPGSMHQYNGEEAVATGICAHLDKEDYITSTHRGHGHCIAKGADVNRIMAEMFAKSTGSCKGMGGSMHIADFGVGMLGANGIVGGGIPHAVGAAWTCQYKNNGHMAVAFFGDGASNEGSFHESLNLASIWKLPIVFVCENNIYGFSTNYHRTTNINDIADRCTGYGIPGIVADGMDVEDVYNKMAEAVKHVKSGKGPVLLECKTYRFMGHSRFEKPNYRTEEECNEWKKRDPIVCYPKVLKKTYGVTAKEIEAINNKVDQMMDEAVAYAESSPSPAADDYLKYIYAD